MNIANAIETLNLFGKSSQANSPETPVAVARQQQAADAGRAELSPIELAEIVQNANKAMELNRSKLKFLMDPDGTKPVVQIIDQETQEVLKQIPSVEMLKIAKAIEKMQGILMSREV
jgi:flagellar protein FlaG